jgi:hypothetical protein
MKNVSTGIFSTLGTDIRKYQHEIKLPCGNTIYRHDYYHISEICQICTDICNKRIKNDLF